MLFVPENIRADRMAICKGCPHLTARNTCGTPVVGSVVKHEGKKLRTCGCFMDVKTRLKGFGCPLNKWLPYEITKEEVCEIQKLIASFKGKNQIDSDNAKKIVDSINKFQKRKAEYTTCSPCIVKYIQDLDKLTRDVNCEDC